MSQNENIEVLLTLNDADFNSNLDKVLNQISNALSKTKSKVAAFINIFKGISTVAVHVKKAEAAVNQFTVAKFLLAKVTKINAIMTMISVAAIMAKAIVTKIAMAAIIAKTVATLEATEAIMAKTVAIQEVTEAIIAKTATILEATEAIMTKTVAIQEVTEAIMEKIAVIQEATEAIMEKTTAIQETTEAIMEKIAVIQEATEAIMEKTAAILEVTEAIVSKTIAVEEVTESIISQIAAIREATEAIIIKTGAVHTVTDAIRLMSDVKAIATGKIIDGTVATRDATEALNDKAETLEKVIGLIKDQTTATEGLSGATSEATSETKFLENATKALKFIKLALDVALKGLKITYNILKIKKIAGTAVKGAKAAVTTVASFSLKKFAIAVGIVVAAIWLLVLAFERVVNLIERLIRLFGGAGDSTGDYAREARGYVSAAKDDIGTSMDEITAKVRTGFQTMKNQIDESMGKMATTITGNISDITGAFDSLTASLEGAGGNAMQGFINGIRNKQGAIMGAVSQVTEAVAQTLMRILRINSPSRVMRDLGGYTMDGYAIGMEDKQKDVEDVAKSTADTVTDELDKASKMQNKLQSITSKLADTKNKYADQAAAMMKAGLDSAKALGKNMDKMLFDNKLDQKLALAVSPPDADYQTSLMEKLIATVASGQTIVMDSGELVGATYGGYDAAAGEAISYNSRWGR